jgi:Ribbon-helix-helix protein
VTSENRTARLTILIDPRKKALFERLCAEEDAVPSQVVRRLLRRYIEERLGGPWTPGEGALAPRAPRRPDPVPRPAAPRAAARGTVAARAAPPSSGRRSRPASRSR